MYRDTRHKDDDLRAASTRYLMATVVHELNNLTTVLGGRIELAKQGADISSSDGFEDFNETARALGRCAERLHIVSGTSGVPETVDLNEVIKRAREALEKEAGEAALELALAGVPATIGAIPAALEMALLNLVRNAAEAQARHIRLIVAVEKSGEVVLEVRDDGCGVSPEVTQCLSVGHLVPEVCGVGLLLATVVAERAHGRIEAVEIDGGTALRLHFRHATPPRRQLVGDRGAEETTPRA